jgi:ABC-type branched-subunit amino acid transport system substrate-binding protein
MVLAGNNNAILNSPNVWAGAKAAAIRLNKSGGINGQRINIITCNTMVDRNTTTACARTAASDKVIGVLGPTESFVQDALPVLSNARIPFMGSGTSTNEQVGKNSFPLSAGAYSALGGPAIYFRDKLKIKDVAIGVVQTDVGIAAAKQVETVIKGAGLSYKGTVTFPLTTQDYAPIAQQLKSTGAKGIILITGSVLTPSVIQASKQIGFSPAWASSTAGTPPTDAAKYKDILQGVYLGGAFPTTSSNLKGTRQFRADAAAAKAQGVTDTENQNDSMLQSWLMVNALNSVAKKYLKGKKVTGPAMLSALKKAKNIDLSGLGKWSPGGKGLSSAPQLKRGTMFLNQVDNGAYKLVTPKGIDVIKEAKLNK